MKALHALDGGKEKVFMSIREGEHGIDSSDQDRHVACLKQMGS